jgi:hypothetical protein
MSRRNSGRYQERNGIAYTSSYGWKSDTFTERDTAMNAADVNQTRIARLENEISLLKGALNLSRERAEDAEADLALESHRADDAELERDNARVEAMGLAWELGQLRDALDLHIAQVAVMWHRMAPPPRGHSALATTGENAARQPTLIESPAVAKIAAELVAVMAENERVAAPPPTVAPARKRESKLIAPVGNAGAAPRTLIPVRQTPLIIQQRHQYVLKSFHEAQDEANVQIISAWAANQDFSQHHWDEQADACHAALERISMVSAPKNALVAADAAIPF